MDSFMKSMIGLRSKKKLFILNQVAAIETLKNQRIKILGIIN